jgi:hypothetical protein
MIALGLLFVCLMCDRFKPRRQLEAETLALRYQLNILILRRDPHPSSLSHLEQHRKLQLELPLGLEDHMISRLGFRPSIQATQVIETKNDFRDRGGRLMTKCFPTPMKY